MATITYSNGQDHPATLPIGRVHGIGREAGCADICLERSVAIDCPLLVSILIRRDGDVVLWDTRWHTGEPNTYWHFGAGSDLAAETRRPTIAQLATLERMFLKLVAMPGHLNSALGSPVAAWAFAGQTPAEIADKHSEPTPAMNR